MVGRCNAYLRQLTFTGRQLFAQFFQLTLETSNQLQIILRDVIVIVTHFSQTCFMLLNEFHNVIGFSFVNFVHFHLVFRLRIIDVLLQFLLVQISQFLNFVLKIGAFDAAMHTNQ